MNGKPTHRLKLHRRVEAASDFEPSDDQTTEVCEVYATLEGKGGGESESADQQRSHPTVTISFQWGPTVAEIDSHWWATREKPVTGNLETYHFTSVVNVDERNREVVIEAVKV